MADARIATPNLPFNKVQIANVASTYTAFAPSTTKPTAGVIYDVTQSNTALIGNPSLISLVPYHSLNNATGLGMRVTKFNRFIDAAGAVWWIPITIFEGTPAYSTTVGNIPTVTIDSVSAKFFANITVSAIAPASSTYAPGAATATTNLTAGVVIDVCGAELVCVQFISSGTPTMGVFWTTM
jgi:hypothetical protein